MKRSGILALGTLLLFASACNDTTTNVTSPPPAAPPNQAPGTVPTQVFFNVTIVSGAAGKGPEAFGQNPLVVTAGSTVTWINNDNVAHTATSDTDVWDSGTLEPGQAFSFQFNDAGKFPYHCSIHGAASMSGVIQVDPAPVQPSLSPSPSPSPSGVMASPCPLPSQAVSPSPTPVL